MMEKYDLQIRDSNFDAIFLKKRYIFKHDVIVNKKNNMEYPMSLYSLLSEHDKENIGFSYSREINDFIQKILDKGFIVFHVVPVNKLYKCYVEKSDLIENENGTKILLIDNFTEIVRSNIAEVKQNQNLKSKHKESHKKEKKSNKKNKEQSNSELKEKIDKIKKAQGKSHKNKADPEIQMLKTLLDQVDFVKTTSNKEYEVIEFHTNSFATESVYISLLFGKGQKQIKDINFKKVRYVIVNVNNTAERVYSLKEYKLHSSSMYVALQLHIEKIDENSIQKIKKEIINNNYKKKKYIKNNDMYLVHNYRNLLQTGEVSENKNDNYSIIRELQIIDSNNNHVTKKHRHANKVVYLEYFNKSGKIEKAVYKCHYCFNCNKHFDFKSSFDSQMKEKGILKSKLLTRVVDQRGFEITFDDDYFYLLDPNSALTSLGYHVGVTGLTKYQRQKLLKRIIDDKKLTISQIKSIINADIRRFQNIDRYDIAIKHWKEDLEYINGLI